MIAQVTEQAVSALSKASEEGDAVKKKARVTLQAGPLAFPLGGRNERVDYQLQTGVIDNEYFSAVSAHSNYFSNEDFLDFIVDLGETQGGIVELESLPVGNDGDTKLPTTDGVIFAS